MRNSKPSTSARGEPSIARRAMMSMGLRLTVVMCVLTGASYLHLHSTIVSETRLQLRDYLDERLAREDAVFKAAGVNLAFWEQEFRKRYANPPPQDLEARFARIARRDRDGTLRPPRDVDPTRMPQLFAGPQAPVTPELEWRYLVAHDLIGEFGPAWRGMFQDLYACTPENAMILYWPEVPDWAESCAPDLDMTREPYIALGLTSTNPARAPTWTPVYYDKVAGVWMVSLVRPIDVNGKHLLNINHDVTLNELVERTLEVHPKGAHNALFRPDGRLLAHPAYMERLQAQGGDLTIMQAGSDELWGLLKMARTSSSGTVVSEHPDGRSLVALGHLEGPDWYFAVVYPKALISSRALRAAEFVFWLSLLSLLVEIGMLLLVVKKQIAAPLLGLIRAVEGVRRGHYETRVAVCSDDEIGRLAESFNSMAAGIGERDARLADHARALEAQTQELAARNRELDVVNTRLKQALQDARAAAETKGRILANVSHELRTPLNAVLGLTEVLFDEMPASGVRVHLEELRAAGGHLHEILGHLLELARIQAGDAGLDPIDFDPASLLRRASDPHQEAALARGLAFSVDIDATVPERVRGDASRLRRAFDCLVSNAVKFTAMGSIDIAVRACPGAGRTRLRIEVRDTGPGIEARNLERLFQAFEQNDSSTHKVHTGLGLGLAIASRHMEVLGGSLGLERRAEGGTMAWLEMPVDVALLEVEPNRPRYGADSAGTVPTGDVAAALATRRRVLVVEDNAVNQKVLVAALARLGFDVATAGDGREALERFREERFSAILMDCQMPVMDGYEATLSIRTLEANGRPRTPVIAVTANAMEGDREKCLAAGMDDYLAKPVRRDQLAECLERWAA